MVLKTGETQPVFSFSVVMFRLESGANTAWAVPAGRVAKVMAEEAEPIGHPAWAAIRAMPNSYEAYTLLGEVYNAMGYYSDALAGIYVAIRMNPEGAEAYRQQGVSLSGQMQYEKAITALKKPLAPLFPASAF